MIPALFRAAARIRAFFLKPSLHRQLEEELAEHLVLLTEEYERRGLDPQTARREALLKLGSRDAALELVQGMANIPDCRFQQRQVGCFPVVLRSE